MATLNSFFHLMMIFMLYCHFENVETAPECKRHFTDPTDMPQSTFELFHRHGPCSPTVEMNMPSTRDILEGDRLRVEFLQTRFKPKTKNNKYDSRFQDTKKEVKIPTTTPLADGIYAIIISLGTPGQNFAVAFDTTNHLTWIRCFPNHSFERNNHVAFRPSDSTSFSSVSSASELCIKLFPNHKRDKTNNNCSQDIENIDGSVSEGVISYDKLNIIENGTDVFQNFIFLCTTYIDNQLNLNMLGGILGLGRNSSLSFVRETDQKYGRIFSYCIPSDESKTGFLKLGNTDYQKPVHFTPFITNSEYPFFYFINITSISVGNSSIDTSGLMMNPGTIIDPGVSYTRLPVNVYNATRDEYKKQMNNAGYSSMFQEGYDADLDTCYDYTSVNISTTPNISFTFSGDVTLHLDFFATFYEYDSTKCLAFTGNDDIPLPIFGNFQQKTLEVVYDYEGKGLGFIPGGCN